MSEDFEEKLIIDKQRIKNSVRYQLPIEITTYTMPRNMELYIQEVVRLFLTECHQEHMAESLVFCTGELLVNAKKANTKRVYFKEKGLNIDNPSDYVKGMETFKDDTIKDIKHYLELQKKAGLYVKIVLRLKGEQIFLEIRNNSKLTVFEEQRIKNKLNNAQQYRKMEDFFSNVLDQSEGAGLGIIIIVLMFQKIGLTKDNYQVYIDGNETVTRIVLPCNAKIFSGSEILTYEFVKMQEAVPLRESKYKEIKKIIAEPHLDRQKFLEAAYTDPTVLLLFLKQTLNKNPDEICLEKLIPQFSDEQIKALFDEKLIGDESLVNDEENTHKKSIYLVKDDEQKTKLWNHAQNAAQFAYNIMKNFPQMQKMANPQQIYSLTLLNSLGEILLACSSKAQVEYSTELCQHFEETEKMIDIFYSGNACPSITMLYLKKIGLKDTFAGVTRCWNNLDYASKKNEDSACVIYLAEMLQFFDENVVEFYQLDKKILEKFNIFDHSQFVELLKNLKSVLN